MNETDLAIAEMLLFGLLIFLSIIIVFYKELE